MTRFVLLDIPSIVDSVANEKVITLDNYYKGFNVNSNLKYASSNQYFFTIIFCHLIIFNKVQNSNNDGYRSRNPNKY